MREHRRTLAGLAGPGTDVGLSLLAPRTQVLEEQPRGTVELALVTRPMPAARPHPVRRYPPAVPSSTAVS